MAHMTRLPVLRSLSAAALLLSTSCGPAPRPVNQDVAFLVPLTRATEFLPASAVLPRAVFDRFHHPLTVVDEPDALFAALGTVSVRLDACFREGGSSGPCQPQVRLVLQPVMTFESGITTRDAAVHVFYAASEKEILDATSALAALRTERKLDVPSVLEAPHPGFSDAEWALRAKVILSPLLARSRIVRATQMGVHASDQAWIFGGLDLSSGVPSDIRIPTLGDETDGHVTSTGGTQRTEITLDPVPTVERSLSLWVAPGGATAATAEDRQAAVASVLRLEDPAVHDSGTVDCATCHVGSAARHALGASGETFTSPVQVPDVYRDTRNLRAFGYFFQTPSVSPRVQREIEAVRADLTQRLENAP
jgi:hypothetical protein